MRWLYLILLVVAVAIVVAFVLENHESTTIKIFRQSLTAPLSLFFVAVYFLGMWSGATVLGFFRRAYHRATEQEPKRAGS